MGSISYSNIGKNIVRNSIYRFLSIFLTAASTLAITHLCSPSEFGIYNLALSITQTACALFVSWPNQAFLRLGRENYLQDDDFGPYWSSRLVIHLCSLSLLFLSLYFLGGYLASVLGANQFILVLILSSAVVLIPLQDLLVTSAQAAGKLISIGLVPLIQKISQLLTILFGVVLFSPTWEVLMFALLVSSSVSSFFALKLIPRTVFKYRFSLQSIKGLLSYSWSMPLAAFLTLALNWADIWFVKYVYGDEKVGHYSLAYTIILMVMSIMVPVSASIAPTVIDKIVAGKHNHIALLIRKVVAILTLSAGLFPICLLIGEQAAIFVFPDAYRDSVLILLILSSAIFSQISISLLGTVIYTQEHLIPRMTVILCVMVATKILLNFVMLDKFGILSPAIATVSCYGLGMFLQWRLVKTYIGFKGAPEYFLAFMTAMFLVLTYSFTQLGVYKVVIVGVFSLALIFTGKLSGQFSRLPLILRKFIGVKLFFFLRKRTFV